MIPGFLRAFAHAVSTLRTFFPFSLPNWLLFLHISIQTSFLLGRLPDPKSRLGPTTMCFQRAL
jgi:hypothetical protein